LAGPPPLALPLPLLVLSALAQSWPARHLALRLSAQTRLAPMVLGRTR
jgi:hypothetical protein